MIPGQFLTTREILDRLLANASANGEPDDYLRALRDALSYDDQHRASIAARGHQERVILGFKAAVAMGWIPELPREATCRKCQRRPHLPLTPWCEPCAHNVSAAIDAAPPAPFEAP